METRLDLQQLGRTMCDVEYKKSKFSALFHRMRNPKATCAISSNGYIICVGTSTVGNAMLALRKTRARVGAVIGKDRKSLKLHNFRVHNVAGTFGLGASINLRELSCLFTRCQYEPTVFSGLRIRARAESDRIKATVYASGKVILTGARDIDSLVDAFKELDFKISTWLAITGPFSDDETAGNRSGQHPEAVVLQPQEPCLLQ